MAKYTVLTTKNFEKDFKRCMRRGYPMDELRKVVGLLADNGTLPACYHPHILHGNLEGIWECHIKSDWLLLWDQNDEELTLVMLATGSHSDMF